MVGHEVQGRSTSVKDGARVSRAGHEFQELNTSFKGRARVSRVGHEDAAQRAAGNNCQR